MAKRATHSRDLAVLCGKVLKEQLRQVNAGEMVLHVPQLRDHVMESPGLHFHFNTDLMVGLAGVSRLEFINEHFNLEAGNLALIPGGIPHREVPLPRAKDDGFENLVISVYNQTVSVQHQVAQKGELKTKTEYYDTAKYQLLAQYLEEIAELKHDPAPGASLGIKGLLLIYLSTLEAMLHRVRHLPPVEKLKISQAKRLVQENLGNPSLGVKFMADSLHCSSDYLSNLYRSETGERLVTYINKERVKAAMAMLRTTPLTIAEVAYSVGFESQGYFSRVFKQIVLKNPASYRRSVEHSVVELEGRPRTIYAMAGEG